MQDPVGIEAGIVAATMSEISRAPCAWQQMHMDNPSRNELVKSVAVLL